MIASVDAIKMYLSIKLSTIKKEVIFFKKTYHSNKENHKPMIGAHPFWNDLDHHLF